MQSGYPLRTVLLAAAVAFYWGTLIERHGPPIPDPKPTPVVVEDKTVPVPSDAFRVLVLRHAMDERGPLPTAAAPVLDYLKAKGATYRALDDTTPPEELAKLDAWHRAAFEKAVADSRGKRPWLLAVYGKKGLNEELPADPLPRLKTIGGE